MPQNIGNTNISSEYSDFKNWLQSEKNIGAPTSFENGGFLTRGANKAMEDYLKNTFSLEYKGSKRYDDLTNFNSDYYKQYKSYIEKLFSQISANSLLSPLTGSGFNYGTSQKIATERAQSMNTKRNESISKGVQEFALGSQNQAGGMLEMLFRNQQFQQELAEKRRQYDESSPSFLDSLLNIGGSLLGQFTGGLIGGGGASSARGSSGLAGENGWNTYSNWRK